MRKFSSFLLALVAVASLCAQPKSGYYSSAKGQKGFSLKTALYHVVAKHKDIGYNSVWTAYKTTDLRPDGKIWDMYSSTTNYTYGADQGSGARGEGEGYNREHSFPKSWFNKAQPMHNDLFHLYPTDIYINSMRGNLPFGEVGRVTKQSNGGFSKCGDSKTPGYSGTVFEPNDEYKGDFARTYFYMATAYEDKIASWHSPMLSGNKNSGYKEWAIKMLLRWAQQDPVSQKEIDRNNAVEKIQGNRNPYIDFPGLEQYIWGEKTALAFDPEHYNNGGVTPTPTPTPTPEPTPTPTPDPTPTPTPTPDGNNVYISVDVAADLTIGGHYLIVSEGKKTAAMSKPHTGNYREIVQVTVINKGITTEVNKEGNPTLFTLGGSTGNYTLLDMATTTYLGFEGSGNKLYSYPSLNDKTQWSITFNADGTVEIVPRLSSDRHIAYNTNNPRFACYTTSSNQFQAVKLYRPQTLTALTPLASESVLVTVYDLSGKVVRRNFSAQNLHRLPAGIYIVGGRKVWVK